MLSNLIRRFFPGRESQQDTDNDNKRRIIDDDVSERPYIISSIYYIAIVLFIGLPVWFITCSVTRYSLPDVTTLNNKLHGSDNLAPKLHLDVSIVQLGRLEGSKLSELVHDERADYLRMKLPSSIATSIENVTYNLSWRVRRPTQEESRILINYHSQYGTTTKAASTITKLASLESNLGQIHKSSNRFRLFMFLIPEQYHGLYCDQKKGQDYTLGFDRFVFLCPSYEMTNSQDYEPLHKLIEKVIDETYLRSVDESRLKHILQGRMDLLVSLIPEKVDKTNIEKLSRCADLIHRLYDKNVRLKYPELKELLDIRILTQNVIDLLDSKVLKDVINESMWGKNDTTGAQPQDRLIKMDRVSQLFHRLQSRLNKHSTQNVYSLLGLLPNSEKPQLVMDLSSQDNQDQVSAILESEDSHSLIVLNDDKTLVLGLRGLIRRIIGLSSANLCSSCNIRRDVFFNRWELDAIMGALTIFKLQNIYISLHSISLQNIGVKIPKDLSLMAIEAHELAISAIEHLEVKQTLEAYRLATQGHDLAETAFYDPSLLESLYFPDDVKYAIYTPLFLPLSLSFVISLFRLIEVGLAHRRNSKKDKEKIN